MATGRHQHSPADKPRTTFKIPKNQHIPKQLLSPQPKPIHPSMRTLNFPLELRKKTPKPIKIRTQPQHRERDDDSLKVHCKV